MYRYFVCFLVLSLWSCSPKPTTGEPTNTDSHWLEKCLADDTCNEFSCHRGVCTQQCEATIDCGIAHARCEAFSTLANPTPQQICTATCNTNAECQQHNPDMQCLDRICMLPSWTRTTPDATVWTHTISNSGIVIATPSGLCDVATTVQNSTCFGLVNSTLIDIPNGFIRIDIQGRNQCGWGYNTLEMLDQWGTCPVSPPPNGTNVIDWTLMDNTMCFLEYKDNNYHTFCKNAETQIRLNEQERWSEFGYANNMTCARGGSGLVQCVDDKMNTYTLPQKYKKISKGYGESICGISDNNKLYCWKNSTDITDTKTTIEIIPTQLITGDQFWCYQNDSRVICGGHFPEHSFMNSTYKNLLPSTKFVCGQTHDNTLQCWGKP